MSLFTTLDAPKQQALVEFVKAEKDRECRPLHDHIAEWMLEAIIKGDCEVTGYCVNHNTKKTWLEFTFFRDWENAPDAPADPGDEGEIDAEAAAALDRREAEYGADGEKAQAGGVGAW